MTKRPLRAVVVESTAFSGAPHSASSKPFGMVTKRSPGTSGYLVRRKLEWEPVTATTELWLIGSLGLGCLGLAGIAIVAGHTIVVDPQAMIEAADAAGLFVTGLPA